MKAQMFIPRRNIDAGGQKITLDAIENYLDLQVPLRFELRQRTVGAFLLGRSKSKKSKAAKPDSFKFVFGFDCRGIHSTLKDSQKSEVFDAIESGLKDLPKGETMTLHFGSFSDDESRQEQLDKLISGAKIPQIEFLLKGQKNRVKQLTRDGLRKPKFLRIYCTYTVEPSEVGASDPIEKLMRKGKELWNKFTGQAAEVETQMFEEMFTKAFTDGFLQWEQLLTTKMNLEVTPMLEADLWKHTWNRFNKGEAPPLSQLLTMTEGAGIIETRNTELQACSVLIDSMENCPRPDRRWVFARGKYIGALNFIDKPAGWASKDSQLRYLWEILARDQVYDTELFCDLSRANEQAVRESMQLITKQSIIAADYSSSRQSVDVQAELKRKKTIKAQESLYEGAVPLNVATTVFVHRSTPERLEEACRYLQNCVRLPAKLDREVEVAWLTWIESLAINWSQQLVSAGNKRLTYLTSEAPAFMSLVMPRPCDRSGLELLSEEGGVPIHLDFFNQNKNLGIFGTTRSGKSVLVSGILTQALATGMPIVALDFPKPDGSSTFTDYTRFMGRHGAYFDISTESNNLFELPDLRGMSAKQQKERMDDYKGFLDGALMTMIMGNVKDPMRRNAVRALIVPLLEIFFADPEITGRYAKAIEQGFGSLAWQLTPTLKDFYKFCSMDRLNLSQVDNHTIEAMGQINSQLNFWMASKVGRSISAPSSFRTDAQLLVFALRNLTDDADAAVMALSAYSAALRRALSSPRSIFFIDESPILFEFDDIAAMVARLFANGSKAGVVSILSAQDPDTIANSPSASKILQNIAVRLVGRIQPTAIKSFIRILEYPLEIISRNATESFFPKLAGLFSQWLLDDGGTYTFVRFYPDYFQLAIVANNTDEQACRTAFNRCYSANPYQAIAKFSDEYVAARQSGRPFRNPDGRETILAMSADLESQTASRAS